MRERSLFRAAGMSILVAALVLAAPLALTGCSGCNKEEKPEPNVAAPDKQAPEPAAKKQVAPKAVAEESVAGVKPVTCDVLGLMPQSTMLTMALPSVGNLWTKAVALAKRLAPEGADIDAFVGSRVSEMAQEAGVPDAVSLPDIMAKKGFDPDAPIAIFMDFAPTVEAAKLAMGAIETRAAEAPAANPSADGVPADAGKPAEEPKADAPGAAQGEIADEDMLIALEGLRFPALAIVVGVKDVEKAEASLKELLMQSDEFALDEGKFEGVESGGITIQCYDPERLAYFVLDNTMVVTSSLAAAKEIHDRMQTPATVAYGTAACPAEAPDEIVVLTDLAKILPAVQELAPLLSVLSPQMAPYVKAQADTMAKSIENVQGLDPIVSTVVWTDKKIEMVSRMDVGKEGARAALETMVGMPVPMRLVPLMPENTLAMFAIQLNDKIKQQIKTAVAGIPADAGIQSVVANIDMALGLLGDEIAIGVVAPDEANPLPSAIGLIRLADGEQTREQILMLAPLAPGEKHNDVEIATLGAMTGPVPVYVALPKDVAVVGTNDAVIKKILDLLETNSVSQLFASMTPPRDPATPSQFLFSLNSKLIETLLPYTAFVPMMPPAANAALARAKDTLSEIRVANDLEGNVFVKKLTIGFKDAV